MIDVGGARVPNTHSDRDYDVGVIDRLESCTSGPIAS